MKQKKRGLLFHAVAYALAFNPGMILAKGASPGEMNVIVILADDLGWSDCTLYGTTNLYQTPNIERLAARGLTFNRAHDYLLYNLKEDISETNNLAASYPGRVRRMDRLIERHIQDTEAVVPLPNPAFDPAQYRPELIVIRPGGLSIWPN